MATVTHYIRSHYDPEDRERLERETGQHGDPELEVDPEEAWLREASQVARRRPPPPRFVPAIIPDDQWTFGKSTSWKPPSSSTHSLGESLSGWYRSMINTQSDVSPIPTNSTTSPSHPSNHLAQKTHTELVRKPKESRNKNNWFIMNAIQSEPSSSTSVPAPSLADILARDPPPLPSDGKFAPPVFLEIGPSNKGFGMLQRSGWSEGEPLGPDVIRRNARDNVLDDADIISFESSKSKSKGKNKQNSTLRLHSRQETVEVKMEQYDDVSELRSVDVIDLTLSDSDSDESEELGREIDREEYRTDVPSNPSHATDRPRMTTTADDSPYARKALITPISTVLKSDRLGIGLKAKTVGPYKASQKRVTHNAAALAAHMKAAEESRKRKKLFGRGHRGFERQRNREEENRQKLLAQLKSPW